jgi:hypothetical protein
MAPPPPLRPSTLEVAAVWTAAVAGTLHALASLSWALGSRWLLGTVGRWAVDLADARPLLSALGLGAIGLAKLVAALVPLLVAHGRMPWPRVWRGISWAGGLVLVLYGGVNTVVAQLVLAGAVRPDGGYDRVAMVGHAWLWDPLFLLWGGALVSWLVLSRRPAPRTRAAAAAPW